MTKLDEAQEAINRATQLVRELIMADKLMGDNDSEYIKFLDLWESIHDINSLIDRWNEHEDEVKRELIYDAMQEEGNNYE